jgi:hypothetical protein
VWVFCAVPGYALCGDTPHTDLAQDM